MSSNENKALVPYRPNLQECRSIGDVLAKSGFFADSRRDCQAVAKVLAGRELGLPPFASMTGIYLVKGRLTLSANAMATLIQTYCFPNTFTYRFKYRLRKLTRTLCEIAYFERDSPTAEWEEVGTSTFDEEDRKLAGLGGENWKKYPRNMMFARAMSNGAKMFCTAVFAGHTPYLPDEIDQRAIANEDGGYEVDGTIVQLIDDVQDAEVMSVEQDNNSENGVEEELLMLIRDTNTDPKKICSHYDVTSLADMSEEAIANCKQTLLAKKNVLDSATTATVN